MAKGEQEEKQRKNDANNTEDDPAVIEGYPRKRNLPVHLNVCRKAPLPHETRYGTTAVRAGATLASWREREGGVGGRREGGREREKARSSQHTFRYPEASLKRAVLGPAPMSARIAGACVSSAT